MNRKAVNWLYGQLPDLVAKGILTPEAAERIKEYYGLQHSELGEWALLRVFALVGSVLLGLGVILILGHNWDKFEHLTRLLISMGLLLTAQVAAAVALWRKNDSVSWMEGTSAFLMLSVGASIALVGQTYHLVDDFQKFVLVWMLLSLPLVYLMGAKNVAGMYMVGVVVWLASVQHLGMIKYAAWILLALVLPYYRRMIKSDSCANSSVVLSWFFIFCLYACFSMTWDKQLGELLYAFLFTVTYFVGLLCFNGAKNIWQRPFQSVGLLGSMGLAYFLSFKISWLNLWQHRSLSSVGVGEYLVVFGLVILAIGLCILVKKRKVSWQRLIAALPLVIGAGDLLQFADKNGMYAAMLMNFYLLVVSVSVIYKGTREIRVGILNLGMLMLGALILLRFFDYSYSFVVRGAVFILVGLAFLAVNLVMSRRKAGVIK